LLLEGFFRSDDVVLDDVVAENDANLFAVDERLCEPERVCDAAFAFLVGVVNAVQVKILAIGEETKEVAGILPASDDDDVLDARIHQCLDGVENHRPVVNWQQMLIGDTRERVQARTSSARQDNTLHLY